jgi:hypothetical protein
MRYVEARIIPRNTGLPTLRRASSEASLAITKGHNPRMKAKDVIITGRNRLHKTSQLDQLAVAIAHIDPINVVDACPVRGLGPDLDLPRLAEQFILLTK